MKLRTLQKHWDEFGRRDPLWAILTDPKMVGNKWELDEFFKTGTDEIDALLAYIGSLGVKLHHGRALDFGCGVGRLSQALAAHFEEVVGVDIAPSMIGLARQYNRHGERCRFVLNEAPDLKQFADGWFDFIYSKLVLQHIPPRQVKRYLPELVRVLAESGLLVFQLPSKLQEPPVTSGSLKARVPMPLVRIYRKVRRLFRFPRMENWGLAMEDTVSAIRAGGGTVIDIRPDQSHSVGGPGFRYCVTKTGEK